VNQINLKLQAKMLFNFLFWFQFSQYISTYLFYGERIVYD